MVTGLRSLHRGLSNDLVPLSLVLSRGALSPSRYYFGEQITIRYLLADIISTRALGTGGEMYPTEPHLLRSRTSCIPRFLERQRVEVSETIK